MPSKAIAGETALDASMSRDSLIDREYLTVVWDIDCLVDSDGDGIKDNDAAIGSKVEYEFHKLVSSKSKFVAWDEEIMKPSKTMVVEVTLQIRLPSRKSWNRLLVKRRIHSSN